MSEMFRVVIDQDIKCAECGKPGACESGICLKCSGKAMDGTRPMKSWQGRAVQNRWNAMLTKKPR